MTLEPRPEEVAPPGRSARRTRLLVVAAGAVVVVALAVVLIVRATADDVPTDPHGIAERVAAVMAHPNPNPNPRYSLYVSKTSGSWCVAAPAMCSRTADGGYLVTSPLYCHQAFEDVPLY